MSNFKTTGELARTFGVNVRTIQHILDTHRIEPAAQIPGRRLFDESAAELIRRHVVALVARRQQLRGGMTHSRIL